jgi:hypothetical protein
MNLDAIMKRWPLDQSSYPAPLTLLRLLRRPGLALAIARYLLAARRDGEFVFGRTGSLSMGRQRPSSYPHGSAAKRLWRFLRECLLPTVFVSPRLHSVGCHYAEGFEFTLFLWTFGKGQSVGAGRRGAFMYEYDGPGPDDFPPDDFGEYEAPEEEEYEPEY